MSTGKLDQSLDDILKTRRQSNRRGRGPRRSGAGGRPAATEAPVGGISKPTKQAKQGKATPTGPAASSSGESKIMISNLPMDVEESQLKEYFTTAINVGKPKRILLQYGPNGKSLGSATVIFHKGDQAAKAVKALDNIRIDNRLIKVEVLLSARDAPAPAAQSSLADRVSQTKKDKPKPATAAKATGGAPKSGRGRERGGRAARGGRGGRPQREKKKTVEELDAEMADYFPAGEGAASGGDAPVQAAAGDTAMDDEMI